VNGLPAADGRAIETVALFERVLSELGDRNREVLPEAWQVLELEVDGLDVVALDEVADLLGGLWGQVSVPPMRA